MYFSHLECSVPCGAPLLDPRQRHHLCACGAPLLARYDLERARGWSARARSPAATPSHVALSRAAADLRRRDSRSRSAKGSRRCFTPGGSAPRSASTRSTSRTSRSTRPTRSRRAASRRRSPARRALGADDHRAADRRQCRQRRRRLFRRRRAGLRGLHPEGRQASVRRRMPPLRRQRHAGRRPDHRRRPHGGGERARRSAGTTSRRLKEPYRIEGKKTMAYELAEQMDWQWPDWFVYPTGGGTGMVGMWKAFDELERIGWMPRRTAAEDGVGAGRRVRADRAGVSAGRPKRRSPGKTRRPSPTASGCRARSATS